MNFLSLLEKPIAYDDAMTDKKDTEQTVMSLMKPSVIFVCKIQGIIIEHTKTDRARTYTELTYCLILSLMVEREIIIRAIWVIASITK